MLVGALFPVRILSLVTLASLACSNPAATQAGPVSTPRAQPRNSAAVSASASCAESASRAASPLTPILTARARNLRLSGGWRALGVVYPHPKYEGRPWSQWGQGIAIKGRSFSGIGDHRGVDGNSYVYEFDPRTGRLGLIADVADVVKGDSGFGKIHAQAAMGPCEDVYFATYWGSQEAAARDRSYQGDHLMQVNLSRRTIQDLGVPIPRHGIRSLASSPQRGLLYGEAVDVDSGRNRSGTFFVFDVKERRVVFQDNVLPHAGFLSILVDARGNAYYAAGRQKLNRFDAERTLALPFVGDLPGEWVSASTPPTDDGSVYGATQNPEALFVLTPAGEIEPLGRLPEYVASIALDRKRDRLLFIPDAHGGAWESGTPLMSFDLKTRTQRRLIKLNPAIEAAFDLRAGGSYNIAVDPSGRYAFIGLNAGPISSRRAFGEVILVALELH
jgi:hypothetical protein